MFCTDNLFVLLLLLASDVALTILFNQLTTTHLTPTPALHLNESLMH